MQLLSVQIKQLTKEAHQELEGVVVRQLKAIKEEKDYAQLLGKFYGFFHPLERALDKFLNDTNVPFYHQRRRSSIILDDLRHLNVVDSELAIATELPKIDNEYKALGSFYVLEGSTQGGTIIANMLIKHSRMPAEAVNFFNAYKEKEKNMWQSFREKLDEIPFGSKEAEEVIQAANETFEKFHSWMLFV